MEFNELENKKVDFTKFRGIRMKNEIKLKRDLKDGHEEEVIKEQIQLI